MITLSVLHWTQEIFQHYIIEQLLNSTLKYLFKVRSFLEQFLPDPNHFLTLQTTFANHWQQKWKLPKNSEEKSLNLNLLHTKKIHHDSQSRHTCAGTCSDNGPGPTFPHLRRGPPLGPSVRRGSLQPDGQNREPESGRRGSVGILEYQKSGKEIYFNDCFYLIININVCY